MAVQYGLIGPVGGVERAVGDPAVRDLQHTDHLGGNGGGLRSASRANSGVWPSSPRSPCPTLATAPQSVPPAPAVRYTLPIVERRRYSLAGRLTGCSHSGLLGIPHSVARGWINCRHRLARAGRCSETCIVLPALPISTDDNRYFKVRDLLVKREKGPLHALVVQVAHMGRGWAGRVDDERPPSSGRGRRGDSSWDS